LHSSRVESRRFCCLRREINPSFQVLGYEPNTFTYVKMQFTKFLVAAAAFTLANAQVEFTMNADFFAASYVAGVSVMNLTWHLNSGPVTLKLVNGPSTNLSLVETIKSKDL